MIGIRELAARLGRVPHTVRMWERRGLLPDDLLPTRDDRGWRCWTPEQFEGIRRWLKEQDMRPGKGLPHMRTAA